MMYEGFGKLGDGFIAITGPKGKVHVAAVDGRVREAAGVVALGYHNPRVSCWNHLDRWILPDPTEVINEDDEKLKELRDEYGDTVFKAVGKALMELKEYNASGGYPVPEVWNRKEGRRATMKEIVEYLIKQLKIHKGKGKRKRTS
ncbi:hypothetical protein F3Y22_tig00111877pilonHSYRG00228 [Hibiscus syriacus]|uniref:Factor of DNA methylation 1-5/IDN2 domain-containing protein n=1 Tax=Hibiscus syriacus TaxID=106335 RepID=A0A6A2X966_HIBSY|nr:hypothetical protein F3Y22_tig00111877pilonHSYRG00228 [Hibiscus syriacus]